MVDYLLVGGGLANTFLLAKGYNIGSSLCERNEIAKAKKILLSASKNKITIVLPSDVVVSNKGDDVNGGTVKKVSDIPKKSSIFDIGPETQATFGAIIAKARTIIWNGPVGYIENPQFRRGSDFIYYAITQNHNAISIVGGGDTIAAISKKEYLDQITHLSTGGGAMLEFVEKGTLAGIEVLKH